MQTVKESPLDLLDKVFVLKSCLQFQFHQNYFLALTLIFCTILPIKILTSLRLDHGLFPIKIANKTVPLNPRLIFHPFLYLYEQFRFYERGHSCDFKMRN